MRTSCWVLGVLTAFAAILILANLGDRFLWDDEAETALLARNILLFGVPRAYDGRNLISQQCGRDYGDHDLWQLHPWLPMYLTAASFKIFGVHTAAARLPFAILGILCVPSLYFLSRRLFQHRSIAVGSVVFLLFSVPFLLYSRQCRYYSAAIFLEIWALFFFFATLDGKRPASVGLLLCLTALFHSNFLIFYGTVAGLAFGYMTLYFDRKTVKPFLAAGLGFILLNAPWLGVYGLLAKSRSSLETASPSLWGGHIIACLFKIDLFVFPLALIPIVALLGFWKRPAAAPTELKLCLFLAIFTIVNVLMISLIPVLFFRYMTHLLPVFALLQAWIFRWIFRANRGLGATLLLTVLFSNALHGWTVLASGNPEIRSKKKLKFAWADYLGEITHPFNGPMEEVVRYLNKEARDGDRVFVSHGDLILQFYTKLEIRGGIGGRGVEGWPPPDWIILRHFFQMTPLLPEAQEDRRRTLAYLRAIPWDSYQKIELPCIDLTWENIPEPEAHVFRMPSQGPRLEVYKKKPSQKKSGF